MTVQDHLRKVKFLYDASKDVLEKWNRFVDPDLDPGGDEAYEELARSVMKLNQAIKTYERS